MPYKLNVISGSSRGHYISPRTVRAVINQGVSPDIAFYVTDGWLYHSLPGRPFKHRKSLALVARIAAYDQMPEACWEIDFLRGVPEDEATQMFIEVIKNVLELGPEELAFEMANNWEGKFVNKKHREHYCAVHQEHPSSIPQGPSYKNHPGRVGQKLITGERP